MESTMNQPRFRGLALGRLAALLALLLAITASAAPQPPADTPKAEAAKDAPAGDAEPGKPADKPAAKSSESGLGTALQLIHAGGAIGYVIIFLSVIGLALVFELSLTIRERTLLPVGLGQELHGHVSTGNFTQAEQSCKLRPSYLSWVVQAGLAEVRYGYESAEKAMEEASQEQAARLFRRVEYLAVIGNIAPMLGLLGTVYGILLAFKKVAESKGAAVAADLADGIYLALVTTVQGLIVAIPALAFYAFFRNRIEHFGERVNRTAEQVFVNIRRAKSSRRSEG
jgi:biopolymer transport protein ExbB